jgi:hypothetical protein
MNLDLVIFHKNWPTHGEIFAIEVKILVYVILSHSVKLKKCLHYKAWHQWCYSGGRD